MADEATRMDQLDGEFTGLMLVLSDGTECPVAHMMDRQGQETDDPELAYAVVALNPISGEWIAREVEPVTLAQDYTLH